MRARLDQGMATIQILMPHPMETGLRVDERGSLVPAHHITDVRVTLDGRTVLSAQMSFAMSRDPLLTFRVAGAAAGQRLRVVWKDSLGQIRDRESVIT